MPDIMSAVDIASEFREELANLNEKAVGDMLAEWRQVETALIADMEAFAARFEPGQSLTPGQVLRLERYQALQAQVTAQLTALEGAAGPLITAGQNQAAGLGALEHTFAERDVFETPLAIKAAQLKELVAAGMPLKLAMAEAGFSEERIAEYDNAAAEDALRQRTTLAAQLVRQQALVDTGAADTGLTQL